MFKFYYLDTVFVEGKKMPESICKALNELHDAFTAGVDMSVSFSSDKGATTSINYDIRMEELTDDPLKDRVQRVMNALRTLFRLKAEDWTKYASIERFEGVDCYRARLFMFTDLDLSVRINLRY